MWVVSVGLLAATGGSGNDEAPIAQPVIGARVKTVLTIAGRRFKDSNGNGALDPYEDWRLAVDDRVSDLVAHMTLAEKVGVMLIETLNADCGGTVSQVGVDFISKQQMSHFIFRNLVTATPVCGRTAGRNGQPVTPMQAAQFTNSVQQLREGTRLGIPALSSPTPAITSIPMPVPESTSPPVRSAPSRRSRASPPPHWAWVTCLR